MDYVYSSTDPLFTFGYGLSYTKFQYNNLNLSKTVFGKNEQVAISVDVKNIGKVSGKEVVQFYVGYKINFVSTPVISLRRFSKIELKHGEVRTISFTIDSKDLAIWNRSMKLVAEPMAFDVMIGRSAEEIVLKKKVEYKLRYFI